MSDRICLPINYFLIIVCIFIGLSAWYIQNNNNYNNDNILNSLSNKIAKLEIKSENIQHDISNIDDNIERRDTEDIKRRIFLKKRDEQTLYNDFKPPERRVPETQYPYRYVKTQINIPTRGYPDNYQLLGVLLRDNTESAYNLFGRQKYPGSSQYEYYVQGKMDYNDVKLPLDIPGQKELDDGQIVKIPGTDPSKGEFKVKLYNFDSPRYIPYV